MDRDIQYIRTLIVEGAAFIAAMALIGFLFLVLLPALARAA